MTFSHWATNDYRWVRFPGIGWENQFINFSYSSGFEFDNGSRALKELESESFLLTPFAGDLAIGGCWDAYKAPRVLAFIELVACEDQIKNK